MNLSKMLRSFRYAGAGFTKLIRSENNFQFHTLAALLVITAGVFSHLKAWEWLVISGCIAAVFTAEAFNTAIEKLCDLISKERKSEIGDIKDIAAAGVLLTALASFVAALVIFIPRIMHYFS